MSLPRRQGVLGCVLLALIVCAIGCESDAGVDPVRATGVVSAPRAPLVVEPLPKGWLVENVRAPTAPPTAMQTLYLPPGSTPEHGPALAVGSFGQDEGSVACDRGERSNITLHGPSAQPASLRRYGPLLTLQGEIDTDQPGYVFSRGLDQGQLETAARRARFTARTAEVPKRGLPSGFRRVARAPVIPNGTFGEEITLGTRDRRSFVVIGAYDGDAAANLVARFWRATLPGVTCAGDGARHQLVQHGTNVVVRASAPKAVLDQVLRSLTATDQAGLDAFRQHTEALARPRAPSETVRD